MCIQTANRCYRATTTYAVITCRIGQYYLETTVSPVHQIRNLQQAMERKFENYRQILLSIDKNWRTS